MDGERGSQSLVISRLYTPSPSMERGAGGEVSGRWSRTSADLYLDRSDRGGAPRPVGLPHWGRSRGCRDASVHVNVALRWDKEHPTVGGLDSDVMWVEPSLAPDARPLAPRLRSPDRRSADLHGRANVLGCSTDGVRARSGACTALARRTWVAARTPRGAVARVPWRVQNLPWRVQNLPWCGDSGVERARKRPVAHCRSSRGETTPSRTQPPKGNAPQLSA